MSDKNHQRPTRRSRELRANMTPAECKLWARLSARKVAGIRFNRQFPIGEFICDFVSRGAKLVIEVDACNTVRLETANASIHKLARESKSRTEQTTLREIHCSCANRFVR